MIEEISKKQKQMYVGHQIKKFLNLIRFVCSSTAFHRQPAPISQNPQPSMIIHDYKIYTTSIYVDNRPSSSSKVFELHQHRSC